MAKKSSGRVAVTSAGAPRQGVAKTPADFSDLTGFRILQPKAKKTSLSRGKIKKAVLRAKDLAKV